MSVRSLTGAEASEVSADQRCSFTSGVMVTPSRVRMATIQSAAQARSGTSWMRGERLERDGGRRAVGQVAAEIVPVAAHGERGGADRAAEVEGKDLIVRDSGGTAAPSAPAAPTCRRRSGRPPAYGRHRRHGGKTGTGSQPSVLPKNSGGAPEMLVPFRARPDRRQRDHVGEIERARPAAAGHWRRHGRAASRARPRPR